MLENLPTEGRNPRSMQLDQLSAIEIVELMNDEDAKVAQAVRSEAVTIAKAIEWIAASHRSGGRLFYIGAGTSGRLGVLDASECPPTFNSDPQLVIGIIAGGDTALRRAIEGAEDIRDSAERDLSEHHFSNKDILVGIATSGRTPYVTSALAYARRIGAKTIGFTCNPQSDVRDVADLTITPIVGPEVLSGSTRLKAGTATKMVLNMLTTGAMVLNGKTYQNLMVDLRATNEKLRLRSINIVRELTNLAPSDAATVLKACRGEVKTAVVSTLNRLSPEDARQALHSAGGCLRSALTGTPSTRSSSNS